ncbi:DUF6378 domain-containing protein [Nocardia asteroides]|uniref:DUF6378 domain-containing protein n=1 Tax=Nocardia asteroides TaxID=1824 RepID=UPI0033EBD003
MSIQFNPADLVAAADRSLHRFPDGPKRDEARRRIQAMLNQFDATGVPVTTGGPIPEQPTDIPKAMPTEPEPVGSDADLDTLLAVLPVCDDAAAEAAEPEPIPETGQVAGVPEWLDEVWPDIEPPATTPTQPARTPGILQEAAALIDGERAEQYGDPRDNLARTAEMWTGYLGVGITPADVAHMMILLKVSRARTTPGHRDSLVDIAGYAALAERVAR